MMRRVAVMLPFLAMLVLFFVCLGTTSYSQDALDKELVRYRKQLISYFKPFYLLPILVAEGQRVGDVYASDFWTLEDKSAKCFPTLSKPQPQPSGLPIVRLSNSAHGGFVFGVKKLLGLQAESKFEDTTKVIFSDVTVSAASKGDLRRALSPSCPYLVPIINEQTLGKEQLQTKVILGRVVYGKKSFFIGLDNSTNAAIDTPKLVDALASILPNQIASVRILDAQASASLGLQSQRGVIAETKEVLPIAFAPAFLPKPILDGLNLNESGGQPKTFSWEEFDPSINNDQKALFNYLADALSNEEN